MPIRRMLCLRLWEWSDRGCLMDWDDEYDNGHDGIDYATKRDGSMSNKGAEGGFDPTDIANPVSAYFVLSDDAQDEISGGKKKDMKCGLCGHRFAGESYESCPKCYSSDTEEVIDEKGGGYW